ncbi:MAG: RluA family pseudouridine synthase [Deltaproteobacteria bacterium HGW-Deltaproteobacteria-4]|nr:MAG: RluA family pseudouridine synthase [Deltaproteobacteria bacterium HGW-Deltaproteobacteria-4]
MTAQRRERLLVPATAQGVRLDRYLVGAIAPISRKTIKRALDSGQVFVDGRSVVRAGIVLQGGERIELTVDGEAPSFVVPQLSILWQDENLLAINKPAGLPAHPTVSGRPNALDLVSALFAENAGMTRPILLHRLDADTTGLLLFALTRVANFSLSSQFSEHRIEKTYLALVSGTPPEHFTVSNHLKAGVRGRTVSVASGGLAAQTDFATLACHDGVALVVARPRTGRTHQIRVHLAGLGFPLLGDILYGGMAVLPLVTGSIPLPRHLLHALSLSMIHPHSGQRQTLSAPLPADFLVVLNALGIDTKMVDFA